MNISKNTKIGITTKDNGRLFASGISQNVLTLFDILKKAGFDIILVSESTKIGGKKLGENEIELLTTETIGDFDIIIEVAHSLSVNGSNIFEKSGGKIIVIEYGNNFLINSALTIYKPEAPAFFRARHHETWISPHFEHSREALRTMRKTNIEIAPYVWQPPESLMQKDLKYDPSWNIEHVGILESNLYFVKMCHAPMLICEDYYNKYSKGISAYVLGGEKLKDNNGFAEFAKMLNIVTAGEMSFEGRWTLAHMLRKRMFGSIISHQFYNELNYLQLEAMYLGIPFIHNSKSFEDHGYYYNDINIGMGAEKLKEAVSSHPDNYKEMMERDAEKIYDFSPDNKKNIDGYAQLLESFIQRHF